MSKGGRVGYQQGQRVGRPVELPDDEELPIQEREFKRPPIDSRGQQSSST